VNPWDVKGVPWKSEAAFYGWVRGQLRKGWSRHPVKNLLIQNNRFKKDNGKGRMTWHLNCEQCKKATPQTKIHVDHLLPSTVGGLKTEADFGRFIYRLYFVSFEDLQLLCIPCHDIKTYSERKGCSFEEAVIEKQVICIMKKGVLDLKKWLSDHNEEYLTPKPLNADTIRRILNG
jgi:hypothetical protein